MHTLWHFDPIDMFVHWHVKTLTPLSSDTFGSDMCVCDTFVRDSFDLHPSHFFSSMETQAIMLVLLLIRMDSW